VRALLMSIAVLWPLAASSAEWQHGLSWFGTLKYPADFTHFDWVDADARKGGLIVLGGGGRFDSFNGLLTIGTPAAGVAFGSSQNLLYDRLLEPAADEVASSYGRLAERVLIADDRSTVTFALRPEARYHDGVPIVAADVVFTFDMIREHGSPVLKSMFRPVESATAPDDRTVVFALAPAARRNAEVALLLGNLFALPRHYWRDREFAKTSLEPPLGSGPYRVGRVTAGRMVEWQRVDDYWGRDLPVNRGRFNFDRVRYDYFLDVYVSRQSVRSGFVHATRETIANDWVTAWDTPAMRLGHLQRRVAPVRAPYGVGWVAFLMNLRLPEFQDPRLREALWYCRDFPMNNRVQMAGINARAESYFTGTPFEARGLPSPAELAVLEPLRALVPPRAFTDAYASPEMTGFGPPRDALLRADALLQEAGWVVRDGERVHAATGKRLSIDFPYANALGMQIVGIFARNLERLGIEVRLKQIDSSRYTRVLREFDFGMTLTTVGSGLIPVSELRNRYHSSSAGVPFSNNWAGIADPAVDALVEQAEAAASPEALFATLRALDRVLLWNFYIIPGYYPPANYYVHWNRFGIPPRQGAYRDGYPDTWWVEPEFEQRIARGEAMPPPPPPDVLEDPVLAAIERRVAPASSGD
jgi:microcin C transport system substrate-binding protein